MAITTAGFQGPVTESQEAGRFFRIAPPVLADTPDSPKVTASFGTVTLSAGTLQICGVTITVTGTERVSVTSAAPLAVLEVVWSGENSKVTLVARSENQLVKSPGQTYDAVIAVRTALSATPCLPYGGRGGRMRVATGAGVRYIDAHDGAELVVDDTGAVWSRKEGAWVQTDEADSPWKFYDPVLHFDGAGNVKAGTANLGNGGIRRGRYKVDNGFVIGEIELRAGTSGFYFGAGNFTIDLPPGLAPDDYFEDRWLNAHLYTTAEEPMDWFAQGLIRGGTDRILLFAPHMAADCRMYAARSVDESLDNASGIPVIASGHTDPVTIQVRLFYSLGGDDQ